MKDNHLFRIKGNPEDMDYALLKHQLERKLKIESQCYNKKAYCGSIDDIAVDIAVEIIKHFEGFSPKAYVCPAGVLTIGYGRTELSKPERLGLQATTPEAESLWMAQHLKDNILPVIHKKEQSLGYRFNCSLRAAILSFCYNLGNNSVLKKENGIYKALKAGSDTKEKVEEISRQMNRWVFAGGKRLSGLEKRRKLESVCASISTSVYPFK